MPELLYVVKAVTPDDLSWRARIARNERGLLNLFLAWIGDLHAAIKPADIATAIVGRAADAFANVFQAIAFQPITQLQTVTVEEAELEFDQVVRQLDSSLALSLDVRDPGFVAAVQQQGARLITEVTAETRQSINNVVARAYRDGIAPVAVAPEIQRMIGLTRRQGQAVMNYRAMLEKKGLRADVVASRAQRYADKLLKSRAKTIARTETAKAATQGRVQSWKQAAAHGLFTYGLAEMEWSSVQTDPAEICAQLDGTTVPLGSTWPGGLLPGDAHPNCRCAPILHLPGTSDVTGRMQSRYRAINAGLGIPA